MTNMNIKRIITESINKVLNEKFQSQTLRGLYTGKGSFKDTDYHGVTPARGIGVKYGFDADSFLDKITDDMIDVVGTKDELREYGFRFESYLAHCTDTPIKVYGPDGKTRYAIVLKNGTFVVFKGDQNTIDKLTKLADDAAMEWSRRRKKMYDKKLGLV